MGTLFGESRGSIWADLHKSCLRLLMFFKKTKTLRSSKLCTCSPRDKCALFPEGNAHGVIHIPSLLQTNSHRRQEKGQTQFWREWVGRQQLSTRICLQSHAGHVEAAERHSTSSLSPLTAWCKPSHSKPSPEVEQLGITRQCATAGEGWEAFVFQSHCIAELHSNKTSFLPPHIAC